MSVLSKASFSFLATVGLGTLLLAGAMGCSRSELDQLVPVEGSVLVEGQPCPVKSPGSGSVRFVPDAEKGNTTLHLPHGKVNEQGRYTLLTNNRAGAPPGWYKVGVTVGEPSDPSNPYSVPRQLLPAHYADPETSGLRLEVGGKAESGKFDLKLSKE
jgi:hypothetical protein